MSRKIVLVHGKPGSGKSHTTQEGLRQVQMPDKELNHLSIGNHLRAIAEGDYPSAYDQVIKEHSADLRRAAPLSHETVNAIVEEYLARTGDESLTVVDGYPRFSPQIALFRESVCRVPGSVIGMVGIEVTDDVAVARIMGRGSREGEQDITEDFLRYRLNEHAKHCGPTIVQLAEFYPSMTIDGSQPLDVVSAEFARNLERLSQESS